MRGCEFKAIQTYSDGEEVRWIETQAEGAPEPEFPAPTLTLTAGSGDEHGGSDDASSGEAASADTGGGDDSSSDTLAIIALVVGGLGLIVGGVALVRARAS